jgi:S-methylmethionine-dependent homocysteine/selenocysteine methylase
VVEGVKNGEMKSGVLLLDGGTGEELFARGVPDDREIWSAIALRDAGYHETLKSVHKDFIKAGSRFLTCNNFGVTPGVGFSTEEMEELTIIAGRLAHEARREAIAEMMDKDGYNIMIMGSLPPLVESYRPDKVMDREQGIAVYKAILSCLDEYVDAWLAETLSSSEEVCMAVSAVVGWNNRNKETSVEEENKKMMFVSMTVKEDGCIRSGERASDAVRKILEHADSIGGQGLIRAILFNCSMPEDITLALKDIKESGVGRELEERGILVGAYPNRLTKIQSDWELSTSTEPQAMRDDFTVRDFVRVVQEWIKEYNVKVLGGCCGIGPEYIAACNAAINNDDNYV